MASICSAVVTSGQNNKDNYLPIKNIFLFLVVIADHCAD